MNRSLLFIPGNVPKMLINGDTFGADGIILDLEDSVPFNEKDSARILVRNTLKNLISTDVETVVRVNPYDTPFFQEDLAEIVPVQPHAIVLSKVNGKEDVAVYEAAVSRLEKENGLPVGNIKFMALIESPKGLMHLEEIATSSRVEALIFGSGDMSINLHVQHTQNEDEFLYVRSQIVVAARAYGLRCYDTPHLYVHDMEDLEKQTALARQLGFSGKAAIHPKQVAVINRVFSPSEQEIQRARDMLEAVEQAKERGRGAKMLGNEIADVAYIRQSKELLNGLKRQTGGAANE